MGLLPLWKRPQRAPLPLPSCEDTEKAAIQKKILTWPCWHPDLAPPTPRTMKSTFLLFVRHQYTVFCYSSSNKWRPKGKSAWHLKMLLILQAQSKYWNIQEVFSGPQLLKLRAHFKLKISWIIYNILPFLFLHFFILLKCKCFKKYRSNTVRFFNHKINVNQIKKEKQSLQTEVINSYIFFHWFLVK